MPPSDYRTARSQAPTNIVISENFSPDDTDPSSTPPPPVSIIDGRPYYPTLLVNTSDVSTVKKVALTIVSHGRKHEFSDARMESMEHRLDVSKVSGGITNALFRVSGFRGGLGVSAAANGRAGADNDTDVDKDGGGGGGGGGSGVGDSVLVRVFGAEGMIDRDVEATTYAALCDAGVAHTYLGRFGNGRIEGWLDGFVALEKTDLSDPSTSDAIAVEMARLHTSFVIPDFLKEHYSKAGMWDQLHSWMDQALRVERFRTEVDNRRAEALELDRIGRELRHLEEEVVPKDARVAFCHNDLLAANIMMSTAGGDGAADDRGESDKSIQLIDFEYGGMNYVCFDIANHFNEHAGGTDVSENGVPDYDLFPSEERQKEFVMAYVRAARDSRPTRDEFAVTEEEEASSLLEEVHAFVLANHLYWGLWAVNQAAMEGCDYFDYLQYAENRFKEYYRSKEEESER